MHPKRLFFCVLSLLCALPALYGCHSASSVLSASGGGAKRSVKPEDFGAIGDGTTDDTLALVRTVQSNQDIVFTTGKTYLVSGRITLNPGQKLNGNHATLKKAAQPALSTTNTVVASGVTTQITTNSAPAGFNVGTSLVFSQGAQAQLNSATSLSTSMSHITAIQGSTITLDAPINQSFTGTTDIHVSYSTLELKDGSALIDLIIDGNSANWSWARWECTHEIAVNGAQCIVQNCQILNAPGEGVVVQGSGAVVRDVAITNPNGNGVHILSASHTVIDNVTVANANRTTAIGGQAGCIAGSPSVNDTIVSNCSLTNGLTGIGGFDSPTSSDNNFTNNSIYNCGTGIRATLGSTNNVISANRIYNSGGRNSGIVVSADASGGCQILNNLCINCGIQVSSNGAPPSGVQCISNHIENGDLLIGGVNRSKASQNTILSGNLRVMLSCDSLDITGNSIDNTGDSTRVCIQIDAENTTNLNATQNTLTGGVGGISFGRAGQTNFNIAGNSLNSQLSFGIQGLSNIGFQNGSITGNQISNSLAASVNWQGIYLECQQFAIGQNRINNPAGQAARYGIRVQNSRTVLDGNQALGVYSNAPIQISPACVGVVVQNNVTNAAISDQGIGTVLINNTIVSP